jgi:hypothetical protein
MAANVMMVLTLVQFCPGEEWSLTWGMSQVFFLLVSFTFCFVVFLQAEGGPSF